MNILLTELSGWSGQFRQRNENA